MVISDTTLASGKTKAGTLTMDNVCMTKVGQKQTFNAGLRIEGALTNTHSVTNSAIYDGEGWGLSITSSKSVTVKDS